MSHGITILRSFLHNFLFAQRTRRLNCVVVNDVSTDVSWSLHLK
uniref:Uncharacterized protein n=1 Tax=Anopheles funestus TaxID=62324 RepID=A0A182S1A7_ANOFN